MYTHQWEAILSKRYESRQRGAMISPKAMITRATENGRIFYHHHRLVLRAVFLLAYNISVIQNFARIRGTMSSLPIERSRAVENMASIYWVPTAPAHILSQKLVSLRFLRYWNLKLQLDGTRWRRKRASSSERHCMSFLSQQTNKNGSKTTSTVASRTVLGNNRRICIRFYEFFRARPGEVSLQVECR